MKLIFALLAATILLFSDPLGVRQDARVTPTSPVMAPAKGAIIGEFGWIPYDKSITVKVIEESGGHGSGILVDRCCDTEYFLTAKHVANRVGAVVTLVWTDGDTDLQREGKVERVSEESDLSLISSTGWKRPVVKLGLYPRDGDLVIAMGFPNDVFPVIVSIGFITKATYFDLEDAHYFTNHSASCWFGNSGGPLFNRQGELIGINVMTIGFNNHWNSDRMLAVPVDQIRRFVFGE